MICGVDEAGKGPAIGNLVICGVVVDNEDFLIESGVKDSKLLNKKQREEIYEKIVGKVRFKIVQLTPTQIDEALKHPSCNLNILEAAHTATILEALEPKKAIVDCPDPVLKNYKRRIQKYLSFQPELICEHRAEKHAVVAAASIIAKVTRDEHIEELKKELGVDFGSGYASDPKTQKFLKENWKDERFSNIIRKEWASYKNLKVGSEQRTLF